MEQRTFATRPQPPVGSPSDTPVVNPDVRQLRLSAVPRAGTDDRPRRIVERLPVEADEDAYRSER